MNENFFSFLVPSFFCLFLHPRFRRILTLILSFPWLVKFSIIWVRLRRELFSLTAHNVPKKEELANQNDFMVVVDHTEGKGECRDWRILENNVGIEGGNKTPTEYWMDPRL